LTVIVALKDKKNNRIILGTDKQMTYGYTKDIIDSKILNINIPVIDGYGETVRTDECYIAVAGMASMTNFIEYSFEAPSLPNNMEFMEYLHKKFLKCLRDDLFNNKIVGDSNNKFDSESNLIIVYGDEIF